jgi:hypothetical protein
MAATPLGARGRFRADQVPARTPSYPIYGRFSRPRRRRGRRRSVLAPAGGTQNIPPVCPARRAFPADDRAAGHATEPITGSPALHSWDGVLSRVHRGHWRGSCGRSPGGSRTDMPMCGSWAMARGRWPRLSCLAVRGWPARRPTGRLARPCLVRAGPEGFRCQPVRPASWASRATWVRLLRSSLVSMREMWAFTVATLMNSSPAISALDLPRPTAMATSRSRSLS